MNNIDKVQYDKADDLKISKSKYLKKLVSVVITVWWMLVGELLYFLISLLQSKKNDSIDEQLCLVTGGANGLGRCLALKFAEQKCNIVIVDILDPEPTVKEIVEKFGVKCQGFKCDISDHKAVESLKLQIEASMGHVDILVNNAGLLFMGTLESSSIENIQKCVAVNLTSQITTVKVFLPEMIKRKKGKIIAISSVLAKCTTPLSTVYSATKYGVDGFMEALFDDLCLDNNEEFIKLTSVYPYFMNTRKELAEMLEQVEDFVPRMTPEFVADEVIKGVLSKKRKILITPCKPMILINQLPCRIRKYLKTSTTKAKEFRDKHYE